MATSPSNGANPAASAATVAEPVVRVIGQFIKDLSFENPGTGRIRLDPSEQPTMRVEVNVNAQNIAPNVFESILDLKAHCSVQAGVLYELEIQYGALLQVENVPEEQLEPFLLINCPALTFPFVRRLVADITREGGFQPLLLDPIDFGSLYQMRLQQAAQGTAPVA